MDTFLKGIELIRISQNLNIYTYLRTYIVHNISTYVRIQYAVSLKVYYYRCSCYGP